MELSVLSDLTAIVVLSSLLGGLGGFAFDVAYPLKRVAGYDSSDFDNQVSLPRLLPGDVIDFGFLGPMLVGAVAAVATILSVGVQPAGSPPVGRIGVEHLVWMSLVAGFAATAVLDLLRTRLKETIQGKAREAVDRAADRAMEAAAADVLQRLPRLRERLCSGQDDAGVVAREAAEEVGRAARAAAVTAGSSGASSSKGGRWRARVLVGLVVVVVALLVLAGILSARPDRDRVAGVAVPDVVGLALTRAVRQLEGAGFAAAVDVTRGPGRGIVVDQDPAGGAVLPPRDSVRLILAHRESAPTPDPTPSPGASPDPTPDPTPPPTPIPTPTPTPSPLGAADLTVVINDVDVDCPEGAGSCVTTVVFTVDNSGDADVASAFDVLIEADPDLSVRATTTIHGLAAGDSTMLKSSLPAGRNCFDPNCSVRATADAAQRVAEANEGNNVNVLEARG